MTLKYPSHPVGVKNFRKVGPANVVFHLQSDMLLSFHVNIVFRYNYSRKKKITHVSISDAEIELLLKGYQLHPCSWDRILNYVTERCENLPDEALKYYKVATKKQLKSRLCVKLGKLQQALLSSIANESIR